VTLPRPLNLALLGTGRIANTRLAPALSAAEGARLWSVLSRDPARAAAFAARHGAAASHPAHANLDTLLADPDLDAVVVATPDGVHAEQILAAIRAGKHVLTEKPMTTSSEEGTRVVEAALEAGVRLGVAYHLRWHAGHRRVAALVAERRLGELRHMRVQWAWPAADASNWRAHEAVGRWWSLAGVGTHCLDLVRWLMVPNCGEVRRITGVTTRSVWQGPHDETAVVALEFESGATAEFCSSVLFESPSRVEVYGSADYAIGTDTLGPLGAGTIVTRAAPVDFEVVDPFVGEMEDFVGAIREERPPEVDGAEGLRNVELLEQIPGFV